MSNAKLVKQLRELSGAGMMDCKRALEEVGGDLDKAMELCSIEEQDIFIQNIMF